MCGMATTMIVIRAKATFVFVVMMTAAGIGSATVGKGYHRHKGNT